jgi:hypothetical protein
MATHDAPTDPRRTYRSWHCSQTRCRYNTAPSRDRGRADVPVGRRRPTGTSLPSGDVAQVCTVDRSQGSSFSRTSFPRRRESRTRVARKLTFRDSLRSVRKRGQTRLRSYLASLVSVPVFLGVDRGARHSYHTARRPAHIRPSVEASWRGIVFTSLPFQGAFESRDFLCCLLGMRTVRGQLHDPLVERERFLKQRALMQQVGKFHAQSHVISGN